MVIEAYGQRDSLLRFIEAIGSRSPQGSSISKLDYALAESPAGEMPDGFSILASSAGGQGPVMPGPDIAVCDECLAELDAPGDPRFGNAFISCTYCGPRYSIMRAIPYDRENTAMDAFPLCPLCGRQYASQRDRRFHAQTVCCNACGPTLTFYGRNAQAKGEAAISQTAAVLQGGGIAAIKGIGGYHLACLPADDAAVAALRALKGREHKPLAVMFPDMKSVLSCCSADTAETALLQSPARPIVLLRRTHELFSQGVSGSSPDIGTFLPYTPLQHLLLRAAGPLVMTSANVSSLPIIKDDQEMMAFFRDNDRLDCVLVHNREIVRRLDDSVAALAPDGPVMFRRARGYVPASIPASLNDSPDLMACGAQEKNTLCFYSGGHFFLSAEIGDLDSQETDSVYRAAAPDMQSLLGIAPAAAVCDMHPGYASTRFARSLGIPVIPVQHHFAHIASVMAEHGLDENVIGVAFDGTGYGTDGTVWGGEFLVCSPDGFTRAGHLKPVTMLASDVSVRQAWKSAACMLIDAGIEQTCDDRFKLVCAAVDHGINTIRSSSVGRLFDAVSSILGICDESQYGGQSAIELEYAASRQLACSGEQAEPFPFTVGCDQGTYIADMAPCIRQLFSSAGRADRDFLALRFHKTICDLVIQMCRSISHDTGIRTIALSGGVFMNRILLGDILPRLAQEGFSVYRNIRVPAGDGGISLGQAYAGIRSLQVGGKRG